MPECESQQRLGPFECHVDNSNGAVILRPRGHLGAPSVATLRAGFDFLPDRGYSITVDLADDNVLDSARLRDLVAVVRWARDRGWVVTFAGAGPAVVRLLNEYGFNRIAVVVDPSDEMPLAPWSGQAREQGTLATILRAARGG